MKKEKRFLAAGLYLAVNLFILSFGLTYAQGIPHLIAYKGDIKDVIEKKAGQKKDKQDEAATKGKTYTLTFRIYNSETGGDSLWEERQPEVLVEGGKFEVILGSINSLDLRFNEDYWLSIEVDNWGEKTLRERLTSRAYAYMSEDSYKLGGRYPEEYAFFSHTHIGEDIVTAVKEAINADMVDNTHASAVPMPNQLLSLDSAGKLPASIISGRVAEAVNADTVDGIHADTMAIANYLYPLNANAKFPASIIEGVVSDADKLDGKDSSEFSFLGHLHQLQDLSDVTTELQSAFKAAGIAGAAETNRLAILSDIPTSMGLWTDADGYIYPNSAGNGFQITDTGNLFINSVLGWSTIQLRSDYVTSFGEVGGHITLLANGNNVNKSMIISLDNRAGLTPDIQGANFFTDSAGGFKFFTGTDDNHASHKMSITHNGNVGIGTTTPREELEVSGNEANGILVDSSDPTKYARVAIHHGESLNQISLYSYGTQGTGLWGETHHYSGIPVGDSIALLGSSGTPRLVIGNPGGSVHLGSGYGPAAPLAMSIVGSNVGIGMTNPTDKLEVNGGNIKFTNPDSKIIFRDISDGFIGYSLLASTHGMRVYLDTNNNNQLINEVSFSVHSNVPPVGGEDNTGEIFRVQGDGNVGIGTTAPATKLDTAGTIRSTAATTPSSGVGVELVYQNGEGYVTSFDRTVGIYKPMNIYGSRISLMADNVGIGTTEHSVTLNVNGPIYQRGAVLHADYVFEPGYQLETIEQHAQYMWQEKHLKAVPQSAKAEDGQEIVEVGARGKGVLEELEKAHIYIAQLNERLKQLEAKLKD